MMNREVFDDKRRIGSVKAAIRLYGDRILEDSSSFRKPQMDISEVSFKKKTMKPLMFHYFYFLFF